MKTITKYLKNTNNGELMIEQKFTETPIKFPVNYYNLDGRYIGSDNEVKTTGFVEVKEKTYLKFQKKLIKRLKEAR